MDRVSDKKLLKRVAHLVGKAIHDFNMIEPDDHVMVALSGGKDSWCMLAVLEYLRQRAPIHFRLTAVHLDQGEPDAPAEEIEAALAAQSVPYRVIHRDLYTVVETKLQPGQTRCSLCSRLRRGALYSIAAELGCTKISLGHHRDDLVETLLLNQFFAGRISSMPPRLTSDDGHHVVIRPMVYTAESELQELSQVIGYPVFRCVTCDTVDGQRKRVKRLLTDLEAEFPGIKQSILRSLSEIRPSQLMDKQLWSFGLPPTPQQATQPPLQETTPSSLPSPCCSSTTQNIIHHPTSVPSHDHTLP